MFRATVHASFLRAEVEVMLGYRNSLDRFSFLFIPSAYIGLSIITFFAPTMQAQGLSNARASPNINAVRTEHLRGAASPHLCPSSIICI